MKNLIIISGLPGTGKSTLAEAIAREMKIPIFSVDPIESAIIKSGIPKSFETGLAAYRVAEALAFEQLKQGLSVIIDAVNAVNEAREIWSQLSEKSQAKKIVIECFLSLETHKKRIESRYRNLYGIPETTWNDVLNRKNEYCDWSEERLIISSEKTIMENIKKALDYIGKV